MGTQLNVLKVLILFEHAPSKSEMDNFLRVTGKDIRAIREILRRMIRAIKERHRYVSLSEFPNLPLSVLMWNKVVHGVPVCCVN